MSIRYYIKAPAVVRELITAIPIRLVERVRLSVDAAQLADKYIAAGVVGKTSRADCQHIAIATLCRADVLISWNFKHIVNLDRIRGYNGMNMLLGHPVIEIRTPREILNHEGQRD